MTIKELKALKAYYIQQIEDAEREMNLAGSDYDAQQKIMREAFICIYEINKKMEQIRRVSSARISILMAWRKPATKDHPSKLEL